ncbi:MAG: pimeloyl-CoA dehydrogenase large subunit [Comamonadaceae bacterium SCN 68-20]|nr:MAG: pimeloyl-CoA dehydrogenase large subunit [Comamonadaceae bacterium SCN 68-20]
MDLDFSDADLAFQREVREWFAANTPAALRSKAVSGQMLMRDEIVHWQRTLDERGFLVVGWPREHGGPGWTPTQRYLYDLERAAANAPVGLSMGVIMLGPVLMAFGSDAQKAHYLPRIRRCEDWWCQGYSEPGAGSDLASLACAAVRDGDDYVIDGSKIWTTYAHWATHMFCLVRTAKTGRKQEGISFLLIEMDRPGIEVRPIVSIDGEHHLNQVFLTDVRVPRANLVGQEGQGWEIAKYLLTHERTSIAGVAERSAAQRGWGGRPLADDAAMSLRLARAEVDLMALEYTNLRVLSATAAGKAPGPESSLLKLMGTAVQQTLSELALEVGAELAWPWHVQGPLADADHAHAMERYAFLRACTIYGGSDEVQKTVLAKSMLAPSAGR